MEAFVWDTRFVSGIASIDEQHHKLVDITNQLGDTLLQGNVPEEELDGLFKELTDYAHFHFKDEEALMFRAGVDDRHAQHHLDIHAEFVSHLTGLWQTRHSLDNPAQSMHGYLASWLTMHIVGEDQVLARQIRRIEGGESAASAFEIEQRQVDPSANVLLTALGRLYALLSEQNKNLYAANVSLERRVEERGKQLAEANRQLLESEKMVAIGQLAAGVAHEINNPVAFVTANIGALRQYFNQLMALVAAYERPEPVAIAAARKAADLEFMVEDLPALLDESLSGLNRVTAIVQDLKAFSHVDQEGYASVDLSKEAESALRLRQGQDSIAAEIIRELTPLPMTRCQPARINLALMNILNNAVQSFSGRGRIVLRSGQNDREVWLEVEDNGCGIPPDLQNRIFEPFFTTKPVGQGKGLGLTVAHDIVVKGHGGRIDVSSEPGQGSRFRINLPRSAELTEKTRA